MSAGFQNFSGIAVVESGYEGAHDLFLVGEAENMGIGDHVGTVPGMAVVVDEAAYIMKKAGGGEERAIPFGQAMEALPVIEEIERHGCDIPGVGGIIKREGFPVILNGGEEHLVLPVLAGSVDGIVVMKEKPFPDAAARDGEALCAGETHQFGHDKGSGNDDVGPLRGKAGDALSLGAVFTAYFIH